MAKFDIDKNGYNVSQVDEYIDALTLKYEHKLSEQKDKIFALKNENSMLQSTLDDSRIREDEVSKALVFAVEKSEQVENGSRKIYELEVRRMRLIYAKWKDLLDKIDLDDLKLNNVAKMSLTEFEADIAMILKQNEEYEARKTEDEASIKDNLKENSSNYIKNLLNRMEYLVDSYSKKEESKQKNLKKAKNVTNKTPENVEKKHTTTNSDKSNTEAKKQSERLLSINRRFNKLSSQLGLANGSQMLDETISDDNAYFRNITREDDDEKFDLDAILNPTEDLAEIMKAFEDV